MPQGKPAIHTPARPPTPTHIQHPADVYYSHAWRWFLGISALLGLGLIRQRRWGLIASIGAFIAGVLRYAAQHEPAQPQLRHVICRYPEHIITGNWRHQPPLHTARVKISYVGRCLQQFSESFRLIGRVY